MKEEPSKMQYPTPITLEDVFQGTFLAGSLRGSFLLYASVPIALEKQSNMAARQSRLVPMIRALVAERRGLHAHHVDYLR